MLIIILFFISPGHIIKLINRLRAVTINHITMTEACFDNAKTILGQAKKRAALPRNVPRKSTAQFHNGRGGDSMRQGRGNDEKEREIVYNVYDLI